MLSFPTKKFFINFKRHLSYFATEENHSLFMSKREAMLCPPCCWINNSTFSSPLMIFPWWLWNTALSLLWKDCISYPFRKANRKYQKNAAVKSTPFLPLVPGAALLPRPARMPPGETLVSVPTPAHFSWTPTALGTSHSAPNFAT